MIHKASIEEVPYYLMRSYIKFQGHTGWKIDDLDQIWARLQSRSQLSNPSDLPCLFGDSTFLAPTTWPLIVSLFVALVRYICNLTYFVQHRTVIIKSFWKSLLFVIFSDKHINVPWYIDESLDNAYIYQTMISSCTYYLANHNIILHKLSGIHTT